MIIWWRPLLSRFSSNLAAVEQSKLELAKYNWPDQALQDQVRREVDLSESISAFEHSLDLDPANSSANRRLGQIELSIGRYDNALGHLQEAYIHAPEDDATRQLLGEAYIVNGMLGEGARLWKTVNNSQNQLPLRYFWYGSIGDDARQNSIKAVIDSIGENAYE